MGKDNTVEIDVCYNDYFMEVCTIDYRDYEDLFQALENDSQKSFKIGGTTF